jgi:hypothetical protein
MRSLVLSGALLFGPLAVFDAIAQTEKGTPGERSGEPPTVLPTLITTFGGTIAAVCSRCQSQRNYEFATS